MGMFNWVAFEMDCPKCSKPVRGFQTKNTGGNLRVVLPWKVDSFYSTCDYCGTWIQFDNGSMTLPTYDTGAEHLPYPPDGRAKDY